MTESTAGPTAVGPTVASVFRRGYREYAGLPAIVELDGAVITYDELGDRAHRLVAGLQARGLAKGDRVVVLSANRAEGMILDHALALGGYVRAALSYRLHPREVVQIAEDCGARMIAGDAERLAGLIPELGGFDGPVVAFDAYDDPRVTPFADLYAAAPAPEVEIGPEDLVWLPYTSGTSGRPKGVMHTHRSLLSVLRNMLVELPGASTSDVLVHVAPITHLSGYAMMAYFLRGASHIPVTEFEAERYAEIVAEHRATVLPLVPTMINMILPVLEASDLDLSCVHTVVYGGSPIAPDRLARAYRLLGAVFLQSYGLTEMPFNTYLTKQDHVFDPEGPEPGRLASAGRPGPFVEYRLMGDDGPAAPGEPGEIQVRGDAAMSGYWNLPEETAATVLPGGWIATGDVGVLREGFLHVVDRKKDMIVSGGFNVYPTEVENAIYTVEGVDEVAVVGIPDARWGETVHAVVSLRPGAEVTEADIEQACLDRIAPYKRPRSVEFVDGLPKTGTGKIVRRDVKARYWQGRDRLVNG
ncbi:MAG: AMP-binding protein [Gordonia sp. (in: high G+C Gram-positive bacteria)]|uniref:class I adenylate-forming enzyme family protein n=1 Tax=Gordonia sp. (in: high G+C Gram-positive bacteria) TaxID=84139 RepID=UPI0039E44195